MKNLVIFVLVILFCASITPRLGAEESKLHIKGTEEGKVFVHKWKTDYDARRRRAESKLKLDMDYDLTDNISATFVPELYPETDNLSQGIIDSLYEKSKERYIGSIEEAYVLYSGEQYDFSLGKRLYTWGKSDGFKPLDNLNSFEFTDVPDYRKLGVLSASFNYAWPETSVNLVLVPLFTPSRLPEEYNRWAASGPSQVIGGQFNMHYTDISFANRDTALKELFDQYGIDTESGLDTFLSGYGISLTDVLSISQALTKVAVIDDRKLPTQQLRNMQYGIRLNTTKAGWDFSLSYYDGFNNISVIKKEIKDGKLHYIPVYTKMREIGGDFSTTYDRLEVHGEGAWHFTDGQADDDYLEYVLGGNYTWDSSQLPWFEETKLFLEYAGEKTTNYRTDNDYIAYGGYCRPFRNTLLGRLMLKFDEDNQVDVSGAYNLGDDDSFFQPKYTHKFNDNWKIVAGIDWFTGEANDFFGKWDRNDRFFTFVTYSF